MLFLQKLVKILKNCRRIGYDTEVSNLTDRCVLIGVNSYDELGLLHTCKVLDCAGDTECKICLGTNGLTCLTNLSCVFNYTRVYESTRSGN